MSFPPPFPDKLVHFHRAKKPSSSEKNEWPVFDLDKYGSELSQMNTLSLIGNFTQIPERLGELTQLRFLSISADKLAFLHESLGELTQLRFLSISTDNLTSLNLQTDISPLVNLEECFLKNIGEIIPSFLRGLPRLHTLTIASQRPAQGTSRSPFCSLPPWIKEYSALRTLTITNHPHLKTLPDSLGYLPRLESLDLSSNGLIALPSELTNLPLLVKLDVSGNRLERIPHEFKFWDRLKYFRFHDNPLRSLSGIPRANRYVILHRFGSLPEKYSTIYPKEYERCFNYAFFTDPMHNPNYPKLDQLRVPHRIIDGVTPLEYDNNDVVLEALFNRGEAHDQGLEYWDSYLEKKWDQLGFVMLLNYYDKTPRELAMQYIEDSSSLTLEEMDRLKYEGNFQERALLEQQVPPNDPLLMAISARYEVLPPTINDPLKDNQNFTFLL